jgi:hypothetical protein
MSVSEGSTEILCEGKGEGIGGGRPYLQALLAAYTDLGASISRAVFPSRRRVSDTGQLVSRVNPSSMHTLCCLGSFMPLLASNSDRM